MVENTQKIDYIRTRLAEKIHCLGKSYFDVATEYLITGEATLETDGERRLLNDVIYLLTKVSLLERMYVEEIEELEARMENSRYKQITIEKSLEMEI